MTTLTWDGDEEVRDATGVTVDGLGDHAGSDDSPDYDHGYVYGSTTRGLIAYYPLDGDANDATPLGNDGTDNSSAGYITGQVGSQAKDFDGADDRVELPDLGLGSGSDFSISVWFQEDAGDPSAVFGMYDGVQDILTLRKLGADSNLRFEAGHVGGNVLTADGGTIDQSSWYHAVGVFDSSGPSITLYIDGSEAASDSGTVDDFADSAGPWIGARGDGSLHMDGHVDDVRVYDRALSQPEIEALSNLTNTQTVVDGDVL